MNTRLIMTPELLCKVLRRIAGVGPRRRPRTQFTDMDQHRAYLAGYRAGYSLGTKRGRDNSRRAWERSQ